MPELIGPTIGLFACFPLGMALWHAGKALLDRWLDE
jgi:hypothetical protein